MNFRKGNNNDLEQLKKLGIKSWKQYKDQLTKENWNQLHTSLNNSDTYLDLLSKSECLICENHTKEIIGMDLLKEQWIIMIKLWLFTLLKL